MVESHSPSMTTLCPEWCRTSPIKTQYTTLATAFCQEEFTVSEFRRVYEIVWSVSIDARNFHRKVLSADF